MNDIAEIVLFEIKSIWLNENKILECNNEEYVQYLFNKYAGQNNIDGNKPKTKGIGQLSRSINKLIAGEWEPKEFDIKKVKIIYPVLIIHDPHIDLPIYGCEFNNIFQKSLKSVKLLANGDNQIGNLVIKPLTIMTVVDLEILHFSIENFSLKSLLNDYAYASPDRVLSFHNFITTSKYKNRIKKNKYLNNKAIGFFKETQKVMFPDLRNDIK